MTADPTACVARVVAAWGPWQRLSSGFLVSPRHAVVARHAVRKPEYGGTAEDTRLTLGGRTARVVLTRGWEDTGGGLTRGDVALVTLERPIADHWLTLWPADDGFLNRRPWASAAGFPAKEKGKLFRSAGPLGGPSGGAGGLGALFWRMAEGLVARPGMSGGPVWVREPRTGRPAVVGVVTGGTEAIGYAERITTVVYETLSRWVRDGR